MVWWAPIAGAAAGALFGKALEPGVGSSGAEEIYRNIAADVGKIDVPTVEEQYIQIEELVQQGLIDPLEAQEILADPSLMLEITTDPEIRSAQMRGMVNLEELAEGGFSLEDKARLGQIQQEIGAQERGSRERLTQEMAERGIQGSGLELAQQMMLQQSAAQQRSQEGLERAAQGDRRALEAVIQAGDLAGQMRGQEFGEQSTKAQAQDAINQFNVANQRQTQEQNIARQMQSQSQNLAEKQRVADANAARRQEESLRRANLKQQRYQNLLDKERIKAEAMGGAAKAQEGAAKRKGKLYGGLIGAGATAGAKFIKKS